MSASQKVSSAIEKLLGKSKLAASPSDKIVTEEVTMISPKFSYVQGKYQCLNCVRMFKSEPGIKRHIKNCYVEKIPLIPPTVAKEKA